MIIRRANSMTPDISKLIKNCKFRQSRYYLQKNLSEKELSLERLDFLKKLSFTELKLENYISSEKCIERAAEEARQLNNEYALKSTSECFMAFLLENNLPKALIFGEDLRGKVVDQDFQAKLSFYLGTAEVLRENIFEAKDYFYPVLKNKLPIFYLGMAFNNLGVACWWDKYPNYSSIVADDENNDEEEYTEKIYRSKMSDFGFALDFFQTAIYKLEFLYEASLDPLFNCEKLEENLSFNKNSSKRLKSVLDLVDQDFITEVTFISLNQKIYDLSLIKNPLTIIPLFNLAEMLLSTSEDQKLKEQGLMYLHFSYQLLSHYLKEGSSAEGPLKKIISSHRPMLKSLYLRTITFLSMIEEIDSVL